MRSLYQNEVIQVEQEFHQPYRVTWGEDQKFFKHSSEIFIYRDSSPPLFLSAPGKLSCMSWHIVYSDFADDVEPYPGFEIACTIEVDLEDAYRASPSLAGKDGRMYRDIPVSAWSLFLGEPGSSDMRT
jgi:hypothetical protein